MKTNNTKIAKRALSILAALLLIFSISSCGRAKTEESFTVNVICESKEIYQIFYSCYINDEYYGMGGMADYDKNELTRDTSLKLNFTKSYFEGLENPSGFSIDFSPYGKGDTSERGTTGRVYIDAEYGGEYTIVFSGNDTEGYTADLKQDL